jgi:hypothetical protein
MKYVRADILGARDDYILQQCNCLCIRGHGLAATLAQRFEYANPYALRHPIGTRNLAVVADRATPGSFSILYDPDQKQPAIINLFGQWRPGSVTAPYFHSYPESDPPETINIRERWFATGLTAIGDYLRQSNPQRVNTIAVPYHIGCGLAKGDWTNYSRMLAEFQEAYKDVAQLTIYDNTSQ